MTEPEGYVPTKRESASGVGKAQGCLRKWAWQYIDKVYQPQSAENAIGLAIHKMQEEWLRDGVAPLEGHPYRALHTLARPHLPTPGVATIEARNEFTAHSVDFVAIIDVEYYDDRSWCVHLIDHKVSKWAPKYVLRTREDYLKDPQFVLYAYYLTHVKYPTSLHLKGGWVYYKVENPNSNASYTPAVYPYSFNFGREEIREAFLRVVLPIAEKLVQLRRKEGLRASNVPGNIEHCDAYGGCYYRTRGCNPITEGDTSMGMNDLDDLFGETEPKTEPVELEVVGKPSRSRKDKINAPEKSALGSGGSGGAGSACIDEPTKGLGGGTRPISETTSTPSAEFLQRQLFAVFDLCRNGDPVRTLEALRPIARDLLK